MQRYDFYFGQLVTQQDLDDAFDGAEQADRAIIVDQGVFGIMQGMTVAEAGIPNLTVELAGGRGYDQTGRRVLVPSTQVVDLSAFLPVGVGNSRWVTIVVGFDRALSDLHVDDNNVDVLYNRAESFSITVLQGAEAAVGPARPALPSDGLVVADMLLVEGQAQILDADIDMATDGRRSWAFELLDTLPAQVKAGTITAVAQAVLSQLNTHVSGVANEHPATAISSSPSAPAAARGVAGTTVQANLDELAVDFAALGFFNRFTAKQVVRDELSVQAHDTAAFAGAEGYELELFNYHAGGVVPGGGANHDLNFVYPSATANALSMGDGDVAFAVALSSINYGDDGTDVVAYAFKLALLRVSRDANFAVVSQEVAATEFGDATKATYFGGTEAFMRHALPAALAGTKYRISLALLFVRLTYSEE